MLTSEAIKQQATQLGFDLCGIAPAGAFPELTFLREWIDRGFAGTMAYLPRTAARRADVRRVMPSAQSVVVTGTVYNPQAPYSIELVDREAAEVARYARSDDYHGVVGGRLQALVDWMRGEHPEPFDAMPYVDTGPVQERVYAQHAGLGWIGRNTCVINPEIGSWILLGEIICSLPLAPDPPALDQCGTCTLCLEACPTGAIVQPYVLDATRCISYLTIEQRGPIRGDLASAVGNHVFGCDVCQEVCPWNARPAPANAAWPGREELGRLRLRDLASCDDDALAELIDGTPMTRAGVAGLRRNLDVCLANAGEPSKAGLR